MAKIINDVIEGAVWDRIMTEYDRSCIKHPIYTSDVLRRVAIIAEEAGEAVKAALDLTRPSNPDYTLLRAELREEVVQTAAMCVKMLMMMEREDACSQ